MMDRPQATQDQTPTVSPESGSRAGEAQAAHPAIPFDRPQMIGFGSCLLLILIGDLTSKWLLFPPPGTDIATWQAQQSWPAWIDLAWNTGVAWSLFNDIPGLVTIMTLFLIPLLIAVWWRYYRQAGLLTNLAFGLIIGGALGNAYDRVLAMLSPHMLGVRDFISVDLAPIGINYIWPTFNIADSGICVGFLLLLLQSFRHPPAASPATEATDAS